MPKAYGTAPLLTEKQLSLATCYVAALIHKDYISRNQPPRSIEFVFIEDVP